MALYSLFKITVLCALFQAAAAVRRQPSRRHLARASGLHHRAAAQSANSLHQSTAPVSPAQVCTGTREENNPATNPLGLYSASGIPVGEIGLVKYVDLKFEAQDFGGAVTYTQDLMGCAFVRPDAPTGQCVNFFGTQTNTFKDGRFNGNQLIPVNPGPGISVFDRAIDQLFNIEWCPDQNNFLVSVFGKGPYTLEHKPKASDASAAA